MEIPYLILFHLAQMYDTLDNDNDMQMPVIQQNWWMSVGPFVWIALNLRDFTLENVSRSI